MIRTGEYKLLRDCWPRAYDNSPRQRSTEVELYDLRDDPHERENIADDPAYARVRVELLEQLRDRLRTDDDPVVDGPVPPTSGAFDVRI